VTTTSIVQITAMDRMKTSSCANGTPPRPTAMTIAPKASPPPRMRQSSGWHSLDSERISRTPETEMAGMISPSRKTVSRE
jgi:hypothetical protein